MRGIEFTLALSALLAAVIAFVPPQSRAAEIELPEGPGRNLVYGQCRTCHDLQYLKDSAGITRDDWDQIIISMRQYGLRIPTDMRGKILDYLGTYLGPNPPKATQTAKTREKGSADGSAIFAAQCQACHQATGKGIPGMFPPLAGNADLFRDRMLPAFVVLHGLEGPIEVEGRKFNSMMPPFAHLSDEEVSAVIDYVRSAWGNDKLRPAGFKDVGPEDVAKARSRKMAPADVRSYRANIK